VTEENQTEVNLAVQETSGLMIAESNRAVAEIQGQMVMARKFPRTFKTYMPRILEACQRKKLAKAAAYAYPRGGTMVTGPSIRLAEILAQNYGNLDFGIRELSSQKGESQVQSYCYDLETNVRSQKTFTVKHMRWTKASGNKKLVDPRDIYEHIANSGARRLRACILAIVPGDVVDKALDECEKTNSDQGKVPIKDKIVSMINLFEKLGVSVEMLEKRLMHKIEATDWAEISSLAKIYNSINDGMAKRQDFFELPKGESEAEEKIEDLKKGLQADQKEITIKDKDPVSVAEPDPPETVETVTNKPTSNEVEKPEVLKKESEVQKKLREQIDKNRKAKASKK